jgi:hypothetical protein
MGDVGPSGMDEISRRRGTRATKARQREDVVVVARRSAEGAGYRCRRGDRPLADKTELSEEVSAMTVADPERIWSGGKTCEWGHF